MDLIRELLVQAEKYGEAREEFEPKVEGQSHAEVMYHVGLLRDAGLVHVKDWSDKSGTDYRIERLTMAGHDFLDAARNPTVWEKALEAAKGKSLSLTLQVLQEVLTAYANKKLGLSDD